MDAPRLSEPDTESAVFRRDPGSTGLRTAVWILASLALTAALWAASGLLAPLCFAVLLAFALRPGVEAAARRGVPRALAALLLLGIVSAAVVLLFIQMQDSTQALVGSLPSSLREVVGRFGVKAADLESAVPVKPMLWAGALGSVVLAGTVASVVLLTYFLLSTGDLLRRRLAATAGPDPARRMRLAALLDEIETSANRYLLLIFVTNILLGIATWLAFRWANVSHAGAWGLLAALAHFVPYVGPGFISIGSAVAGAAQFNSIADGVWIGLMSLAIAAFIGIMLTTWLAGRAAGMNVLAVFVTLFFWGWIWGIEGLFLGTPIMMAVKVVAARTPSLLWLHEALRDDQAVFGSTSWRRKAAAGPRV